MLIYSTYLGGGDWDQWTAIAVDANGNAYVTGWTVYPDFPTHAAHQDEHASHFDAYVTKIGVASTPDLENVNLDARMDVTDAVMILINVVGQARLLADQRQAADVNRYDQVDVSDAVKVLRVIVNLGPGFE